MRPNKEARAIIDRIEYATIATTDNKGTPWNTPVYFACDTAYAVYWGSHTDAKHSQNIHMNGQGFILIYNSTVKPGTGEGVYMQARCSELSEANDIAYAHKLIRDRRNPIPYWKQEEFMGADSPIRLYKAVPEHVWMNSENHSNGIYIDTRITAEET
jgi:hypothetical protein